MNEKMEDIAFEAAQDIIDRMREAPGMLNSCVKGPECNDPDDGVWFTMMTRTPDLERHIIRVTVFTEPEQEK